MVGHMMGGTGAMGGSYVKKEASITSCFLNTCPPQMHPDPWGHADIKSEPGITAEFLMARHEHAMMEQEAEDFSVRKDFNPEKMTGDEDYIPSDGQPSTQRFTSGCFLMCGQTPTLVFIDANAVEASWQAEGGAAPGPYQCPRCETRFPSLRELMDHEPGGRPAPGRRGRRSGGGGRKKRSSHHGAGLPATVTHPSAAGAAPGGGASSSVVAGAGFRCPTCEKSFVDEQLYDVHMRMNTFKPFPCTVCKSHFGSESSLSNHTKHFHKEKHRCPYCPRQYSWKIKLHDHIKQHVDDHFFF